MSRSSTGGRPTDSSSQLHDPYAALLSGKDFEQHVERTTGDYAGVGLLVDARNGWVTVVTPDARLAGRAGRHPRRATCSSRWMAGSAADWTLERAVQAMRGRIGTPIELAVRRDSAGRPLRFRLVRERIHQRAVPPGVLLPEGVGYLSCRWCGRTALGGAGAGDRRPDEPGHAVLLLDLRADPGGLRDEAVEVADLFLDPRQEILVSRGRAPGDNHRWTDGSPQRWR